MKKTERIIRAGLCVSMLVMLLLCVTGCKKETYDFPEDLAAQLPQTTNYNVHKFVIGDITAYIPVVRWNLNGEELFMLIDTGAQTNGLYKNGIKKALPGYQITDILKENKYEFYVRLEDNEYCLDPYGIYMTEEDILDGWLGQTWLTKYNNFVFDYVNNRIDYNQPPITDYDIPMNYNGHMKGQYCIPFTFNGKEMYGTIDTGSFGTFVSLGIIGEEKKEDGLYTVHDFGIGNVHYETMEITSGEDQTKWAFKVDNILGYPCFKDHVIQLDFKNNVFRIK